MDIDCDWCICGKKTTNGRLYCSEECKLSDCASDSSINSDYSYLSNSSYASMITVTNCMSTLYNKKINKNYSTFIKNNNGSDKTLNFGYNLNSNGYANNIMNHPSPIPQITVNSKYSKMNMRRTSTGGLITSNLLTMNIPAVTTHVNTSGHIIKTSTSAPKTDIDSVMTPPSYFYNRRYSLPFNKGNNCLNLHLNTIYSTNDNTTTTNIIHNALTPPPIGLLNNNHSNYNTNNNINNNNNNNNNNTQMITNILNNTIYKAITHHNIIKNNELDEKSKDQLKYHDHDQTLKYYERNENHRKDNNKTKSDQIQRYTETLKPITEIIASRTTTTTTTNAITSANNNTMNVNNNINDNIKNNNNYFLYKTNASTNLCALNNKNSNGNGKWNNLVNYKMISNENQNQIQNQSSLSRRRSLLQSNRTSSVESSSSNNHVTPIYF